MAYGRLLCTRAFDVISSRDVLSSGSGGNLSVQVLWRRDEERDRHFPERFEGFADVASKQFALIRVSAGEYLHDYDDVSLLSAQTLLFCLLPCLAIDAEC